MKKWMQQKLICPECPSRQSRLALEIQAEKDDDVIEGQLICPVCHQSYPIHDGVAVLLPHRSRAILDDEKGYNSKGMLSSYLWSHYCDLLKDSQATEAYKVWSSFFKKTPGCALDIGCSVGRLSFELTRTHDCVIGIDNSISFIRKARELMVSRQLEFDLVIEGLITEKQRYDFTNGWDTSRVDFLVADAMALPFPGDTFSTAASVNILEKVPNPARHLTEINRILKKRDALFVFSDPFSWDEAFVDKELWLSGRAEGKYACRGMESMARLFGGEDNIFSPPLTVIARKDVAWKIRKTENLWEHINSQLMVGER